MSFLEFEFLGDTPKHAFEVSINIFHNYKNPIWPFNGSLVVVVRRNDYIDKICRINIVLKLCKLGQNA